MAKFYIRIQTSSYLYGWINVGYPGTMTRLSFQYSRLVFQFQLSSWENIYQIIKKAFIWHAIYSHEINCLGRDYHDFVETSMVLDSENLSFSFGFGGKFWWPSFLSSEGLKSKISYGLTSTEASRIFKEASVGFGVWI